MLLPLMMNAYRMLGEYRGGAPVYDHALARMTRRRVFDLIDDECLPAPVAEAVIERVVEQQIARVEARVAQPVIDADAIAQRVAAAVVEELRRIAAEDDEDEEAACICLLH